eukprot:43021_3
MNCYVEVQKMFHWAPAEQCWSTQRIRTVSWHRADKVTAVDTVGAGDSFVGAFSHLYTSGLAHGAGHAASLPDSLNICYAAQARKVLIRMQRI